MKQQTCEECGGEIAPLKPCYIDGKIICEKCYMSKKFEHTHPETFKRKMQEVEYRIARKKELIEKRKFIK